MEHGGAISVRVSALRGLRYLSEAMLVMKK